MAEKKPERSAWTSWSGLPQMVAYQVAWWVCVLMMGWAGPITMAAFVVVHLAVVSHDAPVELRLVVRSMAVGIVLDNLLAWGGLVTYEGLPRLGLSPLWLVAIWAGFGATLRHSQALFVRSRVHAACTGLIGGPLAYLGGAKLGALTVRSMGVYVVVSGLWLVAMLILERSVRDISVQGATRT